MNDNPYESPLQAEASMGDANATRPAISITAPEAFGVVIRSAGLYLLLYGAWYLTWGILYVLGLPQHQSADQAGLLVNGITFLFSGVWLFMGANTIAQIAYPGKQTEG